MTTIINPLLTQDPLNSTAYRLNSIFQPIQKTRNKKSDFVAYLATPLLDCFVLDAVFAIDVSIRLLNATASLLKAAYIWTLKQQSSESLIDRETSKELNDFAENIQYIGSSIIAQIMNIILSTACLVTRPIASLVELASDDNLSSPAFMR